MSRERPLNRQRMPEQRPLWNQNHTVKAGLSNDFHAVPPSPDDFDKGITRFQRWCIDAPLYEKDPA